MATRSGRDPRIFLPAGMLALVLVAIAAVPTVIFRAQRRVSDRLVQGIDPMLSTVERIDAFVIDEAVAERSFNPAHDAAALEAYRRAHAQLLEEWPRAAQRASTVGEAAPMLLARVRASTEAWESDFGQPMAATRLGEYRRAEGALAGWLRGERDSETRRRDEVVADAQVALFALAALGLLGVGGLTYIAERSRRWVRRVAEEVALNAAKDEFLSIAAHELKTPLAVIRAQAQSLLQRARTTPAEHIADDGGRGIRQLETVERQTARLTRLIGDLLDVSRLQLGRLELHPREVDLADLAARAVEQMQAAEPRWFFSIHCVPAPIAVDAERIEQVLFNLLNNAVKYSAPGSEVRVEVERRDEEVVCSVVDRGIGIPPADRERLFERYFRASNAGETRAKGMGLGLYVSHEIVGGHGGRLWVESGDGEGSVFRFSLPRAGRRVPPVGDRPAKAASGARSPGAASPSGPPS